MQSEWRGCRSRSGGGDLGVPTSVFCTRASASPHHPHSSVVPVPTDVASAFFCATPARRTLSHGYRRAKEAGDQPHSWKLWGHKQLLPWPADPSCFLSLCHSPVAPWSPGPPLIPQHHCDWGLHCGPAKFICCQALYSPHNSVSQALLCMCLIFTIKKTNGKSDRPDTLEGGLWPYLGRTWA